MNHQRPVNLDLVSLKHPPMAIASILHRISGVILFLLLPVILYFLSLSLHSAESFAHLQLILTHAYAKLIVWAFSAAFIYHVIAGIRHLLMDIGMGEGLAAGRRSAIVVITLAIILSGALGVWIW